MVHTKKTIAEARAKAKAENKKIVGGLSQRERETSINPAVRADEQRRKELAAPGGQSLVGGGERQAAPPAGYIHPTGGISARQNLGIIDAARQPARLPITTGFSLRERLRREGIRTETPQEAEILGSLAAQGKLNVSPAFFEQQDEVPQRLQLAPETAGRVELPESRTDVTLDPLGGELLGGQGVLDELRSLSEEEINRRTRNAALGMVGGGAIYPLLERQILLSGQKLFSSGGLSLGKIGKIASGKRPIGTGGLLNTAEKNTLNVKKLLRLIQKITTNRIAQTIIGLSLFAVPFSWNEKNDAVTTLTIAQRDAANSDPPDIETVERIQQDKIEIKDGLFTLRGLTPILGNYDAAVAKTNAAIVAGKVYAKKAEQGLKEGEELKKTGTRKER